MKVLVIGGSRNIGYYAAQKLLKNGDTVTFLLRNQNCFDNDESIKPYIASGQARVVPGDALKEEDVRKSWEVAAEGEGGGVDTVLFTVGGTPKFSVTKGALIEPPDLCTHAMLNVLRTYPRTAVPQPRLVLISSTGLTKSSHAALPLAMKPVYGYLLRAPHADKLGMERTVFHATGQPWNTADGEPPAKILAQGWQDTLGEAGWLKRVLVVRPAMLTDGKCKGDEPGSAPPFRVEDKELKGGYNVSRRDVAYFIVNQALKEWEKWEGKCARIAY